MSVPTRAPERGGRSTRLATRLREVTRTEAAPQLGPKAVRLILRELLFDGEDVPGWRRGAACARPGVDPQVFFPPEGWASDIAEAKAKRICAGCPVRDACLGEALAWENPLSRYGVFGGLTASERTDFTSGGGG